MEGAIQVLCFLFTCSRLVYWLIELLSDISKRSLDQILWWKLSVLTYRVIHSAELGCLQSCFPCMVDRSLRRLRSSCSDRLCTAHPSFYSRQSHVPSFWRCSLERPAGSCHMSAMARFLRQRLKTFLFSCHYPQTACIICMDLAITALFRPC